MIYTPGYRFDNKNADNYTADALKLSINIAFNCWHTNFTHFGLADLCPP